MADIAGTYDARDENSSAIASYSGYGNLRALGPSDKRAATAEVLIGAGPGVVPSAIPVPAATRVILLGCTLELPFGSPAGSLVTLQMIAGGNSLLSIPDGVGFQDVCTMSVPTAPGAPFTTSASIPSNAQIVSSPGSGGPLYRISSALPAGVPFRAFVYVQAIRSGDVPTPC